MLTLVPTPIGNLSDISKRAIQALDEADVIFCEDTRVTKKLLNLLQIEYSNKTFYSMHSHNESEIISKIDISTFDKNVVYVSDAGMPGISDPGSKLIQFVQKNNIKYDVIPGANAVLTALVASGFEGEFTFFGFLPHKGSDREKKLKEIINHDKIAIIYESPHRIEKLLKELTKLHQTFIKDEIQNVELKNTKGEWTFFGFLAHKGQQREKKLKKIINHDKIAIIYESPHRIEKLLNELKKEIPKRIVFFAKELTKIHQTFIKDEVKNITLNNTKGEWVVVIEKTTKNDVLTLSYEDILSLKLHPKEKAKLLSQISTKSTKEIYNELINL